jgi:hypothetical protein
MNFLKGRRPRDRSFGRRLPTVILAMLAVLTAAQAQGNTISISNISVTGPVAGQYTWSYTLQLTSLSALSSVSTGAGDVFPDMLEIFDFGNYVPGSINWAPQGGNPQFAFTAVDSIFQDHAVENLLFPSGVPASLDNAAIRNLKVNYSGPGYVNVSAGLVTLGVLSAKSTSNVQVADGYISTDTGPGGFTGTNFSGVLVPQAQVVPTPHAITGGLALFGLLLVPKARRRLFGA